MDTSLVPPPPGFVDDYAPPAGFIEDVPPPAGFIEDSELPPEAGLSRPLDVPAGYTDETRAADEREMMRDYVQGQPNLRLPSNLDLGSTDPAPKTFEGSGAPQTSLAEGERGVLSLAGITGPEGDSIGAGAARGALGLVDALTTPSNIAMLESGIGAPRALQNAVGAAFVPMMLGGAREGAVAFSRTETPGEKAEAAVGAVGSLAMAGLGAAASGSRMADTSPAAIARRDAIAPEAYARAIKLAEAGAPLTAAETLKQATSNEPAKTQSSSPTARDAVVPENPDAQLREGLRPEDVPARTEARPDLSAAEEGKPAVSEAPAVAEPPKVEAPQPRATEAAPAVAESVTEAGNRVEPPSKTSADATQEAAPAKGTAEPSPVAADYEARAKDFAADPYPEKATPASEATAPPPQSPRQEQAGPTRRSKVDAALEEAATELLPEQADISAPKLDVRRSPFALGVAPDMKALKWLTANTKRLFTSTGDLPKQTFERWIERNGFVKSESRQIAYATRDLYNALKKEFDISTAETMTKGFAKVPAEFVKKMNSALLGEVEINTLPESVRAPLQSMRQHIDALSQTMLDEGVIPTELQAKVADNLGVYMTRSYRVFDDPKWAESIPQDVRNRTREFILSNLQKENPAATAETANAVMKAMLQDWKDQGTGALVKSGGKIGAKDLTSFIARKDIPVVLREFMGEYKDPTVNYARSVTKAANLLGSHRFLNQVKSEGMGKFLFEDGTQPETHSALIAAEGSDVMAPLNGLRTTPEIAAAFREFGKTDPVKNGFAKAYFALVGAAKTSKTVGSVMTQARNLFGQTYFFAMNGHFDMTQAAPAVRAIMADLGAKDTAAGRAAYQRYLRLGVVDQSARASELRDTIRDMGLNDPSASLAEPGMVIAKTARKLTFDAAAKAYQISDDLGKIIGFENELARQRSIHPDWSDATLEATAAERIRNTYPTYSMVPEAIRSAQRLPVAPFVRFASETFRTAYHNLRYTMEDLRSDIPAQKKAGAQRLAGQLAVVGGGFALSAMSQGMLGMNAQDEDDARRFMAPWDKDSQIVFTGKGDGQTTFVNMSYVNPYSYLTDPVIAVASGIRSAEELDDVMLRSFAKLVQPFTSEDILAGALVNIARNKTPTGQRVFNPGDTAGKQFEDKLAHIYKAVEPGTITRAKGKIIPAIKGETDRTGRQPDLSNEVLSELTGFKTQTLDYEQAVAFKAREFKKRDDDADSIFREVAGRRGAVDADDITDAYKRATRSKFEAWKDMYGDAVAAQRRGVSASAVRTALEARGVSGRDAGSVISGKFTPPDVSPSLQKQMRQNKRSLPSGVGQEMKRASGLVLSGSFEPSR